MKKLVSYIYKHKFIFFIMLMLVLPAIILLFLRFSNYIATMTGIDLYIYGISNGEMFLFLGGYIGGIVTLTALYFTITENRKILSYQMEDVRIDKELEHIADAITKLNPLATLKIFANFNALVPDKDKYRGNEMAEIKNMLNYEREQLLFARTTLTMKTTILDVHQKCNDCNNKCSLHNIKTVFITKYCEIDNKLYNALATIETYISDTSSNLRFKMNKIEAEQLLNAALLEPITEAAKERLVGIIDTCNDSIKDTSVLEESIKKVFDEMVEFHNEGMAVLLHNAKSYHFERKHRNYKSCFETGWKNRSSE